MKTLDEVIKELENRQNFIMYYGQDGTEWQSDELYYLKEYRNQKEQIDALPDYYNLVNFWTESHANPELTWEELEQMEGKPIWLVSGNYAGWEIIEYIGKSLITKNNILETNYEVYHQKDFNKSWQAYRKEQN